jgi:hypothetical protein
VSGLFKFTSNYNSFNIVEFVTEIVQLLMSMQVDRINQVQLQWNSNYLNPNSMEYRVLADEATKAVKHRTEKY